MASTLNSSSTREQVLASYADNASYAEDDSIAKARAFITACRLLLSPKFSAKRAKGSNSLEVEHDLAVYRNEKTDAEKFVAARSTSTATASVSHLSFGSFRD